MNTSIGSGISAALGCRTQFALGYTLERLGLLDEARHAYHSALMLNNNHRNAWRHFERLRGGHLQSATADLALPAIDGEWLDVSGPLTHRQEAS